MLAVTGALGVDSEVGRLRVAIVHRPGAELQRLTPRNNDRLLFDGLPWVGRAQEEHDEFAGLLRSRGVEVLLLGDLLVEALNSRLRVLQMVHRNVSDHLLALVALRWNLSTRIEGRRRGACPFVDLGIDFADGTTPWYDTLLKEIDAS